MPDTETLLSRLAAEPALIAEGYETFVRSACRWIVGNAPETLSPGDECAVSDDADNAYKGPYVS